MKTVEAVEAMKEAVDVKKVKEVKEVKKVKEVMKEAVEAGLPVDLMYRSRPRFVHGMAVVAFVSVAVDEHAKFAKFK